MEYFDLSNSQKMLMFSEINNPKNDSFYLKFRKNYSLDDFDYIKNSIELISKNYLNIQIHSDEKGNITQHYVKENVTVETFEVCQDNLDDFIKTYLENPFDDIFDSPLYKWAVIRTENSTVLIGVVQHILLDGTSLFSLIPQEIEKCVDCLKNNKKYEKKDFNYNNYVEAEQKYLNSPKAKEDKEYWLNTLQNYSQDWYSFDDSSFGFYELKLENKSDFNYSPFVQALTLNFLYLAKSKKDNNSFKDMVLNTSVHGRYFGQDDALGMFVNTIPLRLEYDEEYTFEELLSYSKGVLKEGLSHAKLQFSEYTTDLRTHGIDPDCISMVSIVSNSTDYNSQFLSYQKDIKFPLHFRINKNYSDKNGLQTIFIEYDKACFTANQIESIANGINNLYSQVISDSEKKCKEYDVEVNEFFKAENYYNNLINSFNYPTSVSPDTENTKSEFKTIYQSIPVEKLIKLSNKYNIGNKVLLLSLFLFNLTKYSFSKDILIAYNNQATGYHFNTDISVEEYLKDMDENFDEYSFYPLNNNMKLNFESEILFETEDVDEKNHKFIFSLQANNLNLTYDTSYYSKELIESFIKSFNILINKFSQPDELLRNISIVEKEDKDEKFKMELVNEGLINKIFERQVNNNPEKTILYAADDEFTYEQLNMKANRIANALIKKGVCVEDKVMFIMKRSSDLIATVLGIVKAGAAFIPIDPKYPKNRITQILEDSDSKYVIIDEERGYQVDNALYVSELLEEKDETNPQTELTPDNLCFLIYTSGSTGRPKGVMITHRGISNYIAYDKKNVPIYELNKKCNKFISISTVSFIVFLREIFGTILNGLPVVFADDEESINPLKLAELFNKTGADGFGSTPTRLLEYIRLEEIQDILAKCKVLIIGGEAFPPQLYDKLSQYTNAKIYNSYGPTEVTVASHYKLIDSNKISAGWPMLNVVDKIMDIDGNQLPPYVPGEIYVGGAGIARGYINNPEQTKKVFLTINNIPYYNTGDLGKKDEKGELFTLGRNDTQIKIRGLRIELSEIEAAIANYENILHTSVVVKTINSVEHLCAYYTAQCEINSDDLNTYLEDNLPDYMIPSYYTQLETFPTTPNGKTDFKNLPDPKIDIEKISEPTSDIEEGVYDSVCEILGFKEFGVNTDLFKIGLTSLSVIKLSSSILNKFNTDLSIVKLIDAKNIKNISKLIEEGVASSIENENYELTPNQLGIYFDCIKNPSKTNYNLPKMIVFSKDINPFKLKDSIIKVIDLHPYLKNSFVINEGKVFNKKNDSINVDEITIEEVNEVNSDLINDFVKPFEIIGNQLFRFKIYITPDNIVLLADFHHLIVDGTSINIIFNDICALYDGCEDRLFDVGADTYEYISSENNFQLSESAKKTDIFFDEMIAGFDESTVLTTNLSGNEENAQLSEEIMGINKEVIDKFCIDEKISPNILFMSSTVLTLTKFISKKNILISTIFNGRDNPKYRNSIGMLVKTLPIGFKVDRDMSIRNYFDFINKSWFDVLNNSSVNYMKIANKYDLDMDFFYAFHGKLFEDLEINENKCTLEKIKHDNIDYKITLDVIEVEDEYSLSVKYDNALYTPEYIETFIDSIKTIINQLISKQEKLSTLKICDISIVPEIPSSEFKDVEIQIIHNLFEKIVSENPDKTAVICCDDELTYDELNRKANRVAHALINRGVKVGDNVLHMLPRTSKLIIAMLGILKAGAAFIPLANDYPKDRVEYIYENSEADWIISDNSFDNALSIDSLLNESDDESNPNLEISSDSLAYMIYTSGSTGKPKGVMVSHKNISNLLANDKDNMTCQVYHSVERILGLTTVSFDASILDLLGTLCFSRTLIFADDTQTKDLVELVNLIKITKPQYLDTTPSRLLQYLDFDEFREQLQYFKAFSIGGEKFPLELIDKLKEYDVVLYNSYGPTEATVQSNIKKMDNSRKISVGKALFNYITDVRDLDGKLLPDGVIGELYIGGPGVTKGYYNNPEKTKEVFTRINGIKYYRSGDFAVKENEEIHIFGRMDNQIKLRGLRIELDEISSTISQYDSITNVVVVIKTINDVEHLCAYYTASEKVDVKLLKEYLSSKLTDYMVPTVFMQLDKLPETSNGKVDLKNLPEPEIIMEYVAPDNEIEAFFANTFKDILGLTRVGVTDNFFEIGGTSLLVTKIAIDALNNGYDISYGDIFVNPTPRLLAQFILSDKKTESNNKIGDYDYTLIDNLLKKNNIHNFIDGECVETLGNVLLTGATGFLGIHVLQQLLENESGDIYCLVRSKGKLSADNRLKSLLFYYFSEDYGIYFDDKLHIIEGDITDIEDFKKLIPYEINTIINCAGNVKHFSSGTDIEDINYGGVLNGLEFAKLKNCKFVQVSTVSTAGESINNYPPKDKKYTEQDLYIGQSVDNQYLGSKFLAERAILQAACDDNLDVKIMRVGNLMARMSDSEFQINFSSNGFINRIKSFITISKFPLSLLNSTIEFSPIDTTAKSIIELSKTPKDCVVFHPYNNNTVSYVAVLDILKSLGFEMEIVEDEEYEKAMKIVMKDEDKQEGLSGFITSIGEGKEKKIWVLDENNYTIQISYLLGISWPLISYEYIYNFIKFLKEMSFFD